MILNIAPWYTETEYEKFERLHFLASLPLAGTGKREGGEETQFLQHL